MGANGASGQELQIAPKNIFPMQVSRVVTHVPLGLDMPRPRPDRASARGDPSGVPSVCMPARQGYHVEAVAPGACEREEYLRDM